MARYLISNLESRLQFFPMDIESETDLTEREGGGMKRAILPAFLVATLFGAFVRAQDQKERPAATKLDGAWVLVTQ